MSDPNTDGLTKFEKGLYTLNTKGLLELDHEWTAVFDEIGGQQTIIGYAKFNNGYHEMRDREGTVVWVDEAGLEAPLIDPIDIVGPSIVLGIARSLGVTVGRSLIGRGISIATERAATRAAGGRLAAALRRMAAVAGRLLGRRATEEVSGPAGSVARSVLEAAMKDKGATIRLVTKLTTKPQVGRKLYTAVEEGAQVLAGGARSEGQIYVANVPKALIIQLERIGLAEKGTLMMSGNIGTEYKFLAEASEFIVPFFQ